MSHCQEANEHKDNDEEKVVSDLDVLAASLPPAAAASAALDHGRMDRFFVQDTNSRSQDGRHEKVKQK